MRVYYNNLGLRGKVVILISAVVVILLAGVLAVVWAQSHFAMTSIAEADIASRKQAFVEAEVYRMRDRAHITALVGAKVAEWIEHPDQAAMCAFFEKLLNYNGSDQNDSRHIEYIALQAPDGKLLGIAIAGHRICDPQLMKWRTPNVSHAELAKPLMTNWESPDGKIYSIYAAKITKAGSQQLLGTLSLGYTVDDETARLAKSRAGTDVVFWHDEDTGSQAFHQHMLGTSNRALAAALQSVLPESDKEARFYAAGGRYLIQQVNLQPPGVNSENPERIHVGMVESMTDQMRPLIVLQHYLAILAICSLLLGIGLGIILSRPIVRPLVGLANVARDVKQGKFDGIKQLKVDNKNVFESLDEIGILCRAFEDMVAGLKQRRAMSKMISQAAYNSLESSGGFKAPTERKWMAVLFSDIRGFTSFSEGRDPEFVVQRLNDVLGIQAEIVTRHGGDVDKFIGDAMVAWFSGPDRCQRAMEAAREIMRELAARIGDRGGASVGLGLHVGEVIVGAIGNRERMDYTAIGSTVNLASRLCSAAKGGQILISNAVVRELGSNVELRSVPPLSLKGFAEPIPVYEASRPGPVGGGPTDAAQDTPVGVIN